MEEVAGDFPAVFCSGGTSLYRGKKLQKKNYKYSNCICNMIQSSPSGSLIPVFLDLVY